MSAKAEIRAQARKQLDRRLAPLRRAQDLTPPPRGWIRAVRESIGMTMAQLAARTGVSQSRITRIEAAEVNSAITLRTLRNIAEGMNCELVYALVPHGSLDKMAHLKPSLLAGDDLSQQIK